MRREELKPIELENNLGKDVNGVIHRVPWKAYDVEEVDHLLDAMEARIKELEAKVIGYKAQVPKWISVKDRLPSNQDGVIGLVVGTDLVTKDWTPELNERIKRTELCYYVDGDGWYSSEGYQMVVSPRMWMPLPPPPTEESSATEKEK